MLEIVTRRKRLRGKSYETDDLASRTQGQKSKSVFRQNEQRTLVFHLFGRHSVDRPFYPSSSSWGFLKTRWRSSIASPITDRVIRVRVAVWLLLKMLMAPLPDPYNSGSRFSDVPPARAKAAKKQALKWFAILLTIGLVLGGVMAFGVVKIIKELGLNKKPERPPRIELFNR
jgi:hypothetical protein